MKVAIIIVNYNDYNTTKEYVEKIKEYEILDRIVVVDNQSSIQDNFENLKFVNRCFQKSKAVRLLLFSIFSAIWLPNNTFAVLHLTSR